MRSFLLVGLVALVAGVSSLASAQEIPIITPATVSFEVPPEALAKIKIRILDVRCAGNSRDFFLSENGQRAIAIETTAGGKQRYAVWNIEDGKVIRFLSANEGKETKPYEGNESADFGAEVEFPANDVRRFAFSSDGKIVAALTEPRGAGIPGVESRDEIVVWDGTTGKILRRITTTHHHHHTFFFLDEKRLIAKSMSKAGVAIELIDATTGELAHLLKPDNFEMYAGAVFDKEAVFMAPGSRILTVDLEDREPTYYKAAPAEALNQAADRMWFSQDGKWLYVRKFRGVEVWDVARQSFARQWRLAEGNFDMLDVAAGANLMGVRRQKDQQIDFIDVEQGTVRTTFSAPWERAELSGIARDAKRVVMPAGENRVAVFSFPDGLPPGELVVKPLLKDVDKKGTR